MSALNASDLAGNAAALAVPSSRDFEIQRLHLVEHLSTYRVAEKFGISQTRVRQIVQRVNTWLARALPQPTEAEAEQEARLARCLAADQLQHQLEKLSILWIETRDPKYQRQMTRTILAMARLGVTPGAIDGLAADAAEQAQDRDERLLAESSPVRANEEKPAVIPPNGDCSPFAEPAAPATSARHEPIDVNHNCTSSSEWIAQPGPDHLAGLNLMERRLLTLFEGTPADDTASRAEIQATLTRIRGARAEIEVALHPAQSGARVSMNRS
jgi:transposase